ncbi:uncharacterized protein [Choristoneura fumiferana]|uniref:uncharacterized protein n=1 Tax=Choristoneura fumiferana TaxID=7141 RepID=UPI003D15E6E2
MGYNARFRLAIDQSQASSDGALGCHVVTHWRSLTTCESYLIASLLLDEKAEHTPPSAGASRKRRAQTTSDSSSAESSSSEDDNERKVKRKRAKKSDGSDRPIFNLKRLNEHIVPKKFKLISHHQIPHFLQKKDWMTKLDLSSAYFHVSIAESHRRFLRLVYKNQVLQMKCLPFGLSCAPKNFAALTNWVTQILRDQGMRIVVYLDDFLLVNQSEQHLESQVAVATQLLEKLGWTINYQKSILKPTQELDYLGLVWNTRKNFVGIPLKKIKTIVSISEKALDRKKVSKKDTQILLGTSNISLVAEYLPGKYNDIADHLSRGKQATEWHLLQPALKAIFRRFGTPQIDLFASERTKIVERYVTRDPRDTAAHYINAFSQIWRYQLAWVFPPPSLIPRVLHHLNSAEGTFLVVAPLWKKAYWLADLQRRAVCKPMRIRDLESFLIDQNTGRPPPRVQDMRLLVWKIGAGGR